MDTVKLLSTKISIEEVADIVGSPSCGATSLFVGTTRDNFDNKKVVQLEYEAYEAMAETAMKKICSDIRGKWEVQNIAIVHRLGVVPVREASVVIAVSSPHRAESLEAVQFAIDALKSLVPIWKKEVYEGDTGQWKSNQECAWT
ncbi:molybdopterin synthase catalytic subunit-like [Bacillus rossius redtenbacheri]|uniref:molybdopterin synthase catalytic subunit-like n=1 Tax=Bacillus rossius redtenbacheri TaxID=93214 RepID=UPI002FDE05D7